MLTLLSTLNTKGTLPAGVSVASGWMDLDRDFDNVSSFDNQVNLSSSEISLPSMSILPRGG